MSETNIALFAPNTKTLIHRSVNAAPTTEAVPLPRS